jgi:hypothetical protein
MRIHTTSGGLDPSQLRAGSELVLALDDSHGLDVPEGVLAHDHLDIGRRWQVDEAAMQALGSWRQAYDRILTVDDICMPWIWEGELITAVFVGTVADAAALDSAVAHYRPSGLLLMDDDPRTHALAAAVARRRAIPAQPAGRPRSITKRRSGPARERRVRLLRQRLFRSLAALGMPSHVRDGSVLFMSYWPLMALLERMLAGEGPAPAIWVDKLPSGPARSLRAAARGGWVGLPGPVRRGRARRRAARALDAAAPAPEIEVLGLPLGEELHRQSLALGSARAGDDLATAALFRAVFRRGRLRKVLVPYDVRPQMRLVASLAREADVPTLLVAHGAYPLRHTIVDMQVSDEVAIWSSAFGPTVWRWDRPLHVIGYPVPHAPVAATACGAGAGRPRVLVPGRGKETTTALLDDRFLARHYSTALRAVSDALPDARVILRPHPSEGESIVSALAERFPDVDLEVDAIPSITDSLERCDLCIGSASTATFQAALFGTAVAVLNISGYDWCWPLGGNTRVPIARSGEELAAYLERWAAGEVLPGQPELLEALGADGSDATARLLELLDG